ncbi:hypothetical protein [Hydrogenovibrio marinus]|uniref:Uncharacterized protein n=1 Tax=Hydrogenovibrio marinus TaxID=28885 RepID=A0A066ZX92_HYDMR|nr:hypothetical protein [Hydrogenovibrio marinus]KDN94680.1 hypothetical protein EI16_12335 [Hydrogenovibrio marinus]
MSMEPDSIITSPVKDMPGVNQFIAISDIVDPEIILRAECFELPGSSGFFIDFVLHINNVYRRRLSLTRPDKSSNPTQSTRIFKTLSSVHKLLSKTGIQEMRVFSGKKAEQRIHEIQDETIERTRNVS